MRIHEGEFAYDLEQQRDPATQLPLKWKYTLFRLHPAEMIIGRGEAKTRNEAEAHARRKIRELDKILTFRAA